MIHIVSQSVWGGLSSLAHIEYVGFLLSPFFDNHVSLCIMALFSSYSRVYGEELNVIILRD